ncbi:MAG: response regulator [Planctomycetes bacterium]|nr:response regulator [Planctomycetota bacterium]
MRVLLIDDSKSMRAIMRAALQPMGKLDIVEAHDGVDATSKVIACKPQLILCDSDMPKMNGLDFVRALRQTDRNTPVVLISTKSDRASVVEAVEAGVNNYVVKPFTPDLLRQRVKDALAKPAARKAA